MRAFLIVAAAIAVLVLAGMCVFTVDRSEFVYVTQFGQHIRTYDGASDAGLHFRWPWPVQSVLRLDRRLQVLDLPLPDQIIKDASAEEVDRRLDLDGYVCWRIADADAVDRFIRTIGTLDEAQRVIGAQVSNRLRGAIGDKMIMNDFISDEPGRVDQGLDRLRTRVLGVTLNTGTESANLAERMRDDYGIEIVDVRLRRYNYPKDARPAIIERIISERNKKKAQYESEATVKVGQIRQDSELKVRGIEARAAADARRLKGQADADADEIRNQAYRKDVEFYVFLKKLEKYQDILGKNRALLLLSSNRQLFDLLFAPPSPGTKLATPAAPRMTGAEAAKRGGQ
jgi:membrane protease subunit HflC